MLSKGPAKVTDFCYLQKPLACLANTASRKRIHLETHTQLFRNLDENNTQTYPASVGRNPTHAHQTFSSKAGLRSWSQAFLPEPLTALVVEPKLQKKKIYKFQLPLS